MSETDAAEEGVAGVRSMVGIVGMEGIDVSAAPAGGGDVGDAPGNWIGVDVATGSPAASSDGNEGTCSRCASRCSSDIDTLGDRCASNNPCSLLASAASHGSLSPLILTAGVLERDPPECALWKWWLWC